MKIHGKQSPWAKWLTDQLKGQKLTVAGLCRMCKGEIDHSTIRKQLREGKTPTAETVQRVERALGSKCPVWT